MIEGVALKMAREMSQALDRQDADTRAMLVARAVDGELSSLRTKVDELAAQGAGLVVLLRAVLSDRAWDKLELEPEIEIMLAAYAFAEDPNVALRCQWPDDVDEGAWGCGKCTPCVYHDAREKMDSGGQQV